MPPDLWPALSRANVGSYTAAAPTAERGASGTRGQQSHQGKRVIRKKQDGGEDWRDISSKWRLVFFFLGLVSSHKILRQFEALMGGSPHAPANSSHQATIYQLPTATDSSLPTQSADNTHLNHHQPDVLSEGATQNYPSSLPSLATARGSSSEELRSDGNEENVAPISQRELLQNQSEPGRTAEVELVDEASDLNAGEYSPPSVESPCEKAGVSRPSLFSGMELVTKGRPLCQTETADDSLRENPAVGPDSSQPVSAFSFLNFWPTAGTVS